MRANRPQLSMSRSNVRRSLPLAADPPPLLESASPAMMRAISTARQVAASDVAVLLTGESGTGKRTLATAIHNWSPRRTGPFVTVSLATATPDCLARLPRQRLGNPFASETEDDDCGLLPAAGGGTLFFDEVSDLSIDLQGQLLRLLDEHRLGWVAGGVAAETTDVDARVVATTSHDLEGDARARRFREDLFFRLNVVTIAVPPLRERAQDLERLTDYLLVKLVARYHRNVVGIAPEARSVLARYHWPGNVRELLSVLEWAVVLARSDTITSDGLPEPLRRASWAPTAASSPSDRKSVV